MIAYLIALQAAAIPVAKAPDEDVTVIAERAGTVKFKGGVKDGDFYCQVTESAGDIEIDKIICAAFETCAPQISAMMEAIEKKAPTGRERRAAMRAAQNSFKRCSEREEEARIERLADARWEARNAKMGEAE